MGRLPVLAQQPGIRAPLPFVMNDFWDPETSVSPSKRASAWFLLPSEDEKASIGGPDALALCGFSPVDTHAIRFIVRELCWQALSASKVRVGLQMEMQMWL